MFKTVDYGAISKQLVNEKMKSVRYSVIS